MKNEILSNLHNPRELEKMYRSNKPLFKREFSSLYPELKGNTLADCWNERLTYETEEINWGPRRELIIVVFASLLAGLLAKLPSFFGVDEDDFYPRNIGFFVFPVLTAYVAWKSKLGMAKIVGLAATMLAALVYINWLPSAKGSDTLLLAALHLLLFLWCLLGLAFAGERADGQQRLRYLKYNGDLAVMSALILIAGGIMTAITLGLFSLIGLNIEKFYGENIIVIGLPAVPIFATYLIQTNPQLVGKVSPVIAKIFSPMVLVMLVAYLLAMAFSAKNPFNDREFLVVFNVLLIGVMALIFFSVAETANGKKSVLEIWVLLLLSVVTIVANGIALSAILLRISAWGITPNRAAVLGSNVLILANLLLVAVHLFNAATKGAAPDRVGKAISFFLPIYFAWVVLVTFLFPVLFGFR